MTFTGHFDLWVKLYVNVKYPARSDGQKRDFIWKINENLEMTSILTWWGQKDPGFEFSNLKKV